MMIYDLISQLLYKYNFLYYTIGIDKRYYPFGGWYITINSIVSEYPYKNLNNCFNYFKSKGIDIVEDYNNIVGYIPEIDFYKILQKKNVICEFTHDDNEKKVINFLNSLEQIIIEELKYANRDLKNYYKQILKQEGIIK